MLTMEDPTNCPYTFSLLFTRSINPYVKNEETWVRYQLKDMEKFLK